MGNLEGRLRAIVEEMKREGREAGSIGELEQIVLRATQEIGKTAMEGLAAEVMERIPPPGTAVRGMSKSDELVRETRG